MISWIWHVRHARGYRELGLTAEAEAALKQVPASHQDHTEVLGERAALAQELKQWDALAETGQRWARRYPEEPGAWIMWAYGARRAESVDVAEHVLLEGLLHHPNDPTFHFNLGCYACQKGDLPQAHRRVVKAIALDGQFKQLAETDPDLELLRVHGYLS